MLDKRWGWRISKTRQRSVGACNGISVRERLGKPVAEKVIRFRGKSTTVHKPFLQIVEVRAAIGKICGIALAISVSGCGMSSLTSGIGGGIFGGKATETASTGGGVSAETLLTAAKSDSAGSSAVGGDIAHGCPRFQVWSRDGNLTIFETGKVGDGLAVMHRAEITKTARECQIDNGRVTVKYGFSGRVLLGPRGKAGSITMPVTVFVTDAKREKVSNEKVKVDVQVTLDKPIGYFSFVREVSFPLPVGTRAGEFEVYVGFDRNVPGAG